MVDKSLYEPLVHYGCLFRIAHLRIFFFWGGQVFFLYLLPFPMNSRFDKNHLLGEGCEKCNYVCTTGKRKRNLLIPVFGHCEIKGIINTLGHLKTNFLFGGFDGFQIGCGFTMLHGAEGHGCLMVLLDIYTRCDTPPLSVQSKYCLLGFHLASFAVSHLFWDNSSLQTR